MTKTAFKTMMNFYKISLTVLLVLVCASALTDEAQAQRKRREIKLEELQTPKESTVSKGSTTLSAEASAKQLMKTPDAMLQAAVAGYQRESYAEAESLLTKYAALSVDEPLPRRELGNLMHAKSLAQLGRRDEAMRELGGLRLAFTTEDLRREADFDAAALEVQAGNAVIAAKGFASVVGSAWSPVEASIIKRKAAMYLSILAAAFLSTNDVKSLLPAVENKNLRALLLNELARKELAVAVPEQADSVVARLNMLIPDTMLQDTTIYAPYRAILSQTRSDAASLKKQTSIFRLGVVLPVTIDLFDGTENMSLGSMLLLGAMESAENYRKLATQMRLALFIKTAATPSDAVAAATALIEKDSVQMILGPAYSSHAVPVSQLCALKGVPMITPTATDDGVTKNMPMSFQLNPTHRARGKCIAQFLMETYGVKTVGIFAQDSTYGKQMAEGFREEVESKGGDIKLYAILPTGFKRFPNDVLKPLALRFHKLRGYPETKLDAIYIPMSSFESIAITLSQLKFYNITGRVVGSGDWHDAVLLKQYQQIQEKADSVIYAVDSDATIDSPETKRVADAYQQKWGGTPEPNFWLGYDAVDFLAAAVLEKGIGERTKIADAIRNAPPIRTNHSEIFFNGGNVNVRMNIMRFAKGSIERLR
jgi:ABC-type branched-subunit amino acid transport system substrate-binding protein